MIEPVSGDIFQSETEAIVNAVNCVGAMGRGIALQFKNAFPENFKAYEEACRRKEVQPGRMFLFENAETASPRFIINFPTKRHWRDTSRIEDIISGLHDLARVIKQKQIRSVAMPKIGCGLGNLDWRDVRQHVWRVLSPLTHVRVLVFERYRPQKPALLRQEAP